MGNADDIEQAARVLRAGGLVAFPTETVYGLGADAENVGAVERIFAVKGRPSTHPLIVHIGGADQLQDWAADVPTPARLLAERFWPGPLTLVLWRSSRVPFAVTGGLETVALRVPDHPVALALLSSFGGGVAAPSANRFGSVSPTTAHHVRENLGTAVDLVLDGGPLRRWRRIDHRRRHGRATGHPSPGWRGARRSRKGARALIADVFDESHPGAGSASVALRPTGKGPPRRAQRSRW